MTDTVELVYDTPLADFTTLRVGGPARALARCTSTEMLIDVVRQLDRDGESSLILGGGSNLLIADAGYDGTVVQVADDTVEVGPDSVVAQAGARWDDVVMATVQAGLGGLECLSGIPGSAGATPVQNVGAYGVEVASLLRRAQLLDRDTGEVEWVWPEDLGFGYRTSRLKRDGRSVVLAVEYALHDDGLSAPLRYRELAAALDATEGDRRPVADVRAAVLALRASKGMVTDPVDHDTWSAGSFFTNPIVDPELAVGPWHPAGNMVKLSAAWLIEHAGFPKGHPGPAAEARLSTKHTLALTNRGHATAAELVALAREVRTGVHAAFGVWLEPEPVLIGLRL